MEDLRRLIPIDFAKFPFVSGRISTYEDKAILDIELAKTKPDGYSCDCVLKTASTKLVKDYCLVDIAARYAMDRWNMTCVFVLKTDFAPGPFTRGMYEYSDVIFKVYVYLGPDWFPSPAFVFLSVFVLSFLSFFFVTNTPFYHQSFDCLCLQCRQPINNFRWAYGKLLQS